MNISGIQTNFANAVSPFNPLGKQAVGQEETESKTSTLKPIEQPADIFRSEQEQEKKDHVESATEKEKGETQSSPHSANSPESEKIAQEKKAEKLQLEEEQKMIQELSARDREVRAHERAHASVGGQYAGAPTYTYQRGPDGISYAVGGEVSISTSKVAGNPQATIDKAQQVRRAALAPAEPSAQDRRVAASASQMEMEAKQELVQLQRKQTEEEKAAREKSFEESSSAEQTENQSATRQSVERSEKTFDLPSEALIAQASQFSGSQKPSSNFSNSQELHSQNPKQTGASHADLFAGTVVNTHA